jgi:hypothetical protein
VGLRAVNASRVAALLRELADALEEPGPGDLPPHPPRREPDQVRVDEIARAKARRALRRLGEPT